MLSVVFKAKKLAHIFLLLFMYSIEMHTREASHMCLLSSHWFALFCFFGELPVLCGSSSLFHCVHFRLDDMHGKSRNTEEVKRFAVASCMFLVFCVEKNLSIRTEFRLYRFEKENPTDIFESHSHFHRSRVTIMRECNVRHCVFQAALSRRLFVFLYCQPTPLLLTWIEEEKKEILVV